MIYNLGKYIEDEFPDEIIYKNIREQLATQSHVPDRYILIEENGGPSEPVTKFTQRMVQVITRDRYTPRARALAYLIYEKLHGRFGLILPEDTVDGETFPALQAAQISAVQTPYKLGTDGTGCVIFTTNYMIIFKEN